MNFNYSKLTAQDMLGYYTYINSDWSRIMAAALMLMAKTGIELDKLPAVGIGDLIADFINGLVAKEELVKLEQLFKGENGDG